MSSTLLPITSAGGVTSESFTFANGSPVSLSPYMTVNEDTGNINATATIQLVGNTTGYIVSATSGNNYNLYFNRAVGDTAGNMYAVGGQTQNSTGAVWSFDANGNKRWAVSVDQIFGGNRVDVTGIQFNATNSTVVVTLEWYDGTSDQDGILILNADDGTYVSSTLLSTPSNANPEVFALAMRSDGTPAMVGQIQGEYSTTTGLTAQAPSTVNYLWVANSDLPIPVDPGNSPNWQVDTSGGRGSPNWVDAAPINILSNLPTETLTGSGSGATVSVRWTGVTDTYDYQYPNNGGSGYSLGDRIRVRGSNIGGTDNTDIQATATSSSDVGPDTVAVFDKATYPTLGQVTTDWYAFFPSGLAYRVVASTVDTGTTWEVTVSGNGVDFSGPVMFTGGGNDCVMYVGGTNFGNGIDWIASVWPGTAPSKAVFIVSDNTDFAAVGDTWGLRYALDGQAFVWTPSWQHTYGNRDWQRMVDVVCDQADGSIYMLGRFYTSTPSTRRASVIKVDSSGTTLWSKYVDDASAPGGDPGSIALDDTGNVFVIGENDNGYTIVTKLDSDGDLIWQSRQTNASEWDNQPKGAVDAAGNVYIFGAWYDGNIGENVYSLMKLNAADGSLGWARFIRNVEGYSFNENYNNDTQSISVKGSSIYWAGYVYDVTDNYYDAIAGKVPTDGTILGTYGRFTYVNDPDADFEPNTSNAVSETNTTGVPVDTVTQTVSGSSASVTPDAVGSDTAYSEWTMTTGGGGIVFADGTVQTTAAGAGTITSIDNGTSNVAVVGAGGNVVISVADNNMSWTFATDRTLYGKTDEDLNIAVVDDYDDGYQLRQLVVDASGTEYARTSLERGSFRIDLNIDGSSPSWNFDGNQLRVSQDSTIRGFDSSVVLQAMDAGRSPPSKASVQSVSNQNDPNVFTTIDATTTGANIKVYNGGSVSGTEHAWQFDNTGNLTLPGNTFAVNYANGSQVQLGGGGTALPTNAPGYLRNDGVGALTWSTATVSAGSPAYSDVWVNSAKADAFWTEYTLTGTVPMMYDWQGSSNITLTGSALYGKQLSSGDKILVVNDSPIHTNSNYAMIVEFPATPATGDTFQIPFVSQGLVVTAGSFVVGQTYSILQPGSTDFTAIGAANNSPNTVFVATGVGSGTGTATESPGVLRAIFLPATGQRAFTLPQGQTGRVEFGQGTSSIGVYVSIAGEMGSQPITWAYGGVIGGTPTWYQTYF